MLAKDLPEVELISRYAGVDEMSHLIRMNP
jgi:hypothetical protein